MIRDGAHNIDAADRLASFLEKNFTNKKIFYIIGILRDKEYEKILQIMSPFSDDVITIASDNPRALSAEELAECAKHWYDHVEAAGSVKEAVEKALAYAGADDLILFFSFFIIYERNRGNARRWNDIKKIAKHEKFQYYMEKTRKAEEKRIFCRHNWDICLLLRGSPIFLFWKKAMTYQEILYMRRLFA